MCLAASQSAEAASRPAAAVDRASAMDRALRKRPDKLRFRHNIERLVRSWNRAVRATRAEPDLHVRAQRGRAEAWALLAHWSGRRDDRKKAEQMARALVRPAPEPEAPLERINEIHCQTDDRGVRVVLGLDVDAKVRRREIAARSGRRARVFFDLSGVAVAEDLIGSLEIAHPGLHRVRVAQRDARNVRIVFDLETLDPSAVVFESGAVRISSSAADAPLAASHEPSVLDGDANSTRAAPASAAVAPATRLVRSTRRALKPRVRRLLAIRKVVIDAGHGGEDHGAVGRDGVREKDVNLAIAKRLGHELETKFGIEVVYTREDDAFVPLQGRAQLANREGADLFVSIHANANRRRRVHGIETYYLNTTTNRYAKRLARRENLGIEDSVELPEPDAGMPDDDLGSLPEGELGQDLRLILADLAMRSASVESRRLAGYVQSAMVGRMRREHPDVKDLGVKHALFYVLLGARMPSVLIETGFMTHAKEGARLSEVAYQEKLARAIARGIVRFAQEREQIALRREGELAPLSVPGRDVIEPVVRPSTSAPALAIGAGPNRPGILAQARSAP